MESSILSRAEKRRKKREAKKRCKAVYAPWGNSRYIKKWCEEEIKRENLN